jgi:hypothetical protein
MARGEVVWTMAIAIVMAASMVPVSLLVNSIVPHPYMDEIFHIPQAQEYCQGNFRKWDPMITTFPGLYDGHPSLSHYLSSWVFFCLHIALFIMDYVEPMKVCHWGRISKIHNNWIPMNV